MQSYFTQLAVCTCPLSESNSKRGMDLSDTQGGVMNVRTWQTTHLEIH